MEKTKKLLSGWKVILTLFVVTMIFEKIGTIAIPIGGVTIVLLPLLFTMLAGLILTLLKPIKWVNQDYGETSNDFLTIGITLFMAKISINAGAQLETVLAASPALLLQEFGNAGTIFVALPIALLMGMKREAIGLAHSCAREPNVAFVAGKCGTLDCPEGRGVMTTYIVGTLFGGIFISLLSSLLASTSVFHPYALAMACGVGSGSLMAASMAPLINMFPDMAEQISAFAGMSNLLSSIDGIVLTILIYWPLTNFLYNKLEPVLGRGKKKMEEA